jgi:GTP cyclohydrolase FolE2
MGFRDVIAQPACDVFHRDQKRPLAESHVGNSLKEALSFDEDVVRSIDHDFADRLIENQVLDGLKEGQNHFESIH